MLLEQKSIGYVFPGAGEPNPSSGTDHFYSASSSRQNSEELANYKNSAADSPAANKSTADAAAADWKIVVPFTVPSNQTPDQSQVQRPKCLSPNVPDEMSGNVNSYQTSGGESGNDAEVGVDLSPEFVAGIFPSARSRLASLKELGVKKIGALKMKLAENRVRVPEKGEVHVFWGDCLGKWY